MIIPHCIIRTTNKFIRTLTYILEKFIRQKMSNARRPFSKGLTKDIKAYAVWMEITFRTFRYSPHTLIIILTTCHLYALNFLQYCNNHSQTCIDNVNCALYVKMLAYNPALVKLKEVLLGENFSSIYVAIRRSTDWIISSITNVRWLRSKRSLLFFGPRWYIL